MVSNQKKKNMKWDGFFLGLELLAYEVFLCRMFIDSSYTKCQSTSHYKKKNNI
jgi:hypothetical protein